MKKTYMTPTIMIACVLPHKMIAGSTGDTTMSNSFNGDASSGLKGDSRRSFWDDEDE